MAALNRSDLDSALGYLREAETVSHPDPFPAESLARLASLISCDFVSYTELDLARQRVIASVSVPAVADPTGAGVLWRVTHRHPLRRSGASAAKLSDFVSARELHKLEVYTDYLRLWQVEHQLVLRISSTPEVRKTLLFERSRRDFSERDRLLLNLLRPHLVRLHVAARTRRLAAALASGADAAGLDWIVLGPRNEIEFATQGARSLLGAFFGDVQGSTLPECVEAWARQETRRNTSGEVRLKRSEPLIVYGDGRQLAIRRTGQLLLLTNSQTANEDDDRLTPREHEVLALVRVGMSNAEIAKTLSLAHGTVRRHLQNVYAKLGVGSRTAAIASARQRSLPLSS
jgi:DNA-binding NarL/FixJ family response regulator